MVTFLEPEETKSEDEEETTYQRPSEIIVEKPRRHKLQSIRQLHEKSEAPPVITKKDKRYDARERFNPLYGLLIMISATLIAIFTMAVLLQMKRKGAAPKSESMNPYMKKSGNSSIEATTMAVVKTKRICDSPECITLSYQLLNWQDTSIDPCDDFYQAICGKYIKQPENQDFNLLEKKSLKFVTDYFHKNDSSSGSKSENALKMYVQKCEELKTRENFERDQNQGYQDLLEDIQAIMSWPLADKDWDDSKFDLNETLIKMTQLRNLDYGLFQFTTKEKVLKISAHPESKWLNKKFIEVIQKILQANNIEISNQDIQNDMKSVQNFIEILSKPVEEPENSSQINLTTLKTNVPSVDFERIVKSLVFSNDRDRMMERIEVEGNGRFSGNAENLETLLTSTPPRTLANFLILKYISNFIQHVPTEFKDWKNMDCAAVTAKLFPGAAIQILSKQNLEKEHLEVVEKMVENIRKSYIKLINQSAWMHEGTKENLMSKLKNLKKTVEYPTNFEEEGVLDKVFETLTNDPNDSWYTFIAIALQHQNQQNIEYIFNDELLNPSNPPSGVQVYYKKHENSLSVIVPVIDATLFDTSFPKSAKLVSTGNLIAKEMGRSLERSSGWTTKDLNEEQKREECLEKQYREQDETGLVKKTPYILKAMKTDQLAMESLWKTYKEMDLSEETSIPGFHDSDSDKLFFQLYALNFCAPSSSESQLANHYRVNTVLSNMKSFSETFNCPTKTPMNPKTKCELL